MERTKTFVNGGRVYPADLNAIEDRAAEMLEGTLASIPSSHYAGRLYRTTDTSTLFVDNGTGWDAVPSLPFVIQSISATAENGEFFFANAGLTATLPAAISSSFGNQLIGIYNGSSSGEVIVKAAGTDTISGDFFEGKEAKLLKNQHVILQTQAKTWRIIAGEPQREQVYSVLTSRANETEFEPSSTRTTVVSLNAEKGGINEIIVGGVVILKTSSGLSAFQFICPPTKKWKVRMGIETTTLTSSYLLI